jgi:4-diphosphocytidyl-2-C-methyl-D-erythritol kinase
VKRAKRAGIGAGLTVPAFAKINLSLELLGRRADRYWELRTVYQTVTLHDRLSLRLTRSRRVRVRVPGGGAPEGGANLVHQALSRARRALSIRAGVEVEIEKNIPAARGLGGGSSDAAAALVGFLRLTGVRLSPAELHRLGAAVGADVPFFFLGGRSLGVGRGDDVHALPDPPAARCLLLCPSLSISTRLAYRWARRAPLTPSRPPAKMFDSAPGQLWSAGNDFERVIFPRFPELATMKTALLRAGARQAGLSGSGSTVYALFAQGAAARKAATPWARVATVLLAETLTRERYQRALRLTEVLR